MGKIEKMMTNKRKLLVTLAAAGIGVGVDTVTQKGLSQNLMTLLLGLSGSFTVGNAVEHLAKRKKETKNDLQGVEARLESIKDDSLQLKTKVDQALESVALGNNGIGQLVQLVASATTPKKD